MAIVTGNTVMLLPDAGPLGKGAGAIRTAPRLRGVADTVAANVAAFVFWENGRTQANVPADALVKVLQAPAAAGNFLARSFKFAGAAQEFQGVFLEAYIAERNDATTEAHLVALVVGRGDGSPPCFIDMTLPTNDFTQLLPGTVLTTNVYPRY